MCQQTPSLKCGRFTAHKIILLEPKLTAMSVENITMTQAQMNQSWYDTHMKMKRKHNEIGLGKHTPTHTNDKNDTDNITELMDMFEVSDIQARLFVMQQELCAYHTMLDEMEQLRADNKQLEREAADLLKGCSLHKRSLKKDAYNTVQSLENVIVGLKMDLVQSREKEDSHVARMQSVLNEKKTLEEEVKDLGERADLHTTNEICCLPTQQMTNKRKCASAGGLFKIINRIRRENDTQTAERSKDIPEKSSFLSSFNGGAMSGVCERLDNERIHAQRSHSFTAVSA
uniref:Uncharacterized protein n=1 Tax=Ditylum brightwellii TaxID=49249 RepID=A0A7S4QSI6_9STRA